MIAADFALDAARHEGDPEADALVHALGREAWAVNRMLAGVTTDDAPVPDDLRPIVVPAVPAWVDMHRVRRAQALAQRNLVAITLALFCASLPAAYAAPAGARVLRLAGRLEGDVDRRINETARFVLDVVAAGSLDAGGRGRVAIGKVRLVHAAVRAALLARGVERETPLNQEDMLGTLGLFSVLVSKALVRLGVPLSARDRDDWYALWRAVGAMLGIREAYLPDDHASAEALFGRIRARCFGPSEDGRALMAILLQGMERHVGLPGLRALPAGLVRHLLGDHMAETLGVPAARLPFDPSLPGVLRRKAVAELGSRLLDAVTYVKLGGERPTFPMPHGAQREGRDASQASMASSSLLKRPP